MLPPSPFDALLNAQRLYTAASLRPPSQTLYVALPYRQASGSAAPRPFINDTVCTRRGLIDGRYEPLTTGARVPPRAEPKVRRFLLSRPSLRLPALDLPSLTVSTVTSAPSVSPPYYLHTRVDFPVSIHAPRLQQPLSPHTTTLLPQHFSEPSRIRFWRPQATVCLRNGPSARKIRTLRTTSWSRPRRPPRPGHIHRRVLVHAPSRAITNLRPKPPPRAGPVLLRRLLPPHPRT
jgi:hypothetical protein